MQIASWELNKLLFLKLLFYIEYFLGKFLALFSPARLAFEKRNEWEPGAMSFNYEGQKADLCVEFSSEGEFEQVRIFLEKFLETGKKRIEIIFCSESVEASVLEFQLKYKNQVRYQRLSFFTRKESWDLGHWVTADKLILVRYDFFPQLLILGTRMKFFALFSASVKAIKNKNFFIRRIYRSVFKLFDLIVPVNSKELAWFQEYFKISSNRLIQADLRVNQIQKRIDNASETLLTRFSWWKHIEDYLGKQTIPKLMIGNFWEDETEGYSMEEIADAVLRREISLSIAPHNLNEKVNDFIEKFFKKKNLKVIKINEDYKPVEIPENSILLFDIKGVLCELYRYFDIALVGGGFQRNAHSLLEPFVGGAKVITGPRVEKSSEYDFIHSYNSNAIKVHIPSSSLEIGSWKNWMKEKNFRDSENGDKLSSLMERVNSVE